MIQIFSALNDQRLAGVVTFLALGTPAAVARLYSGTRPAFGAAPTGTLLVEIPLQEPIGQVANGSLAITPTDEALILADGVATWARVLNGEGSIAWDCLVGRAAVLTDGTAGTVEGASLDESHGLRISIRGHIGKWPISTIRMLQP